MTHFAIAGLQVDTAASDNIDAMLAELDAVKRRFPWVQMVVFGELQAFGPRTVHAQPLPGPAEVRFCEAASRNGVWLLPGTLFERAGDSIYNTASVINPQGEVVLRYRKMFPFLPYEQGVSSGTTPGIFDVSGVGRFGVAICYDMWFPECVRGLACAGAEVILHPSLTNTIDRDVELSIARASAAVNQCYFFSLNLAPRLGVGRSAVYGPGGELIYEAGVARDVFPIEVDLDHVRRVRQRGWHGLGQALKSFRDSPADLGRHINERARNPQLVALGELAMPPMEPVTSGPLGKRQLDLRLPGKGS